MRTGRGKFWSAAGLRGALAACAVAHASAALAARAPKTAPLDPRPPVDEPAANPNYADTWYRDDEAGVRFRVPFKGGEPKSGAQVTALVLADPRTKIPDGVKYTSGVYAPAGTPFVLVWVRDDARPPTQAALERLAGASAEDARARFGLSAFRFDLDRLRGVGTQRAGRGGLQSRVLAQVAKGRTVYVGLYFKEQSDAQLLDRLAASLEVMGERRVAFADLAPGMTATRRLIAAAVAFVVVAGLGLALGVKRGASAS